MNIPDIFKQLATLFNDEERCGFCWNYKDVEGEDGMNAISLTEDEACCVNIILTWEQKSYSEVYNRISGLVTQPYCDNQFIIYVVKTSNLGTNFGNEQPNHSEAESINATIIQPLFECFTCENVIDLCELDFQAGINQWRAERVLFKGDQNFSGIKIIGSFRKYL